MANKPQKPVNSKDAQDQKSDKKKAFEQGTGNNNTTADDSKMKDNRDLKNQNDMGNWDEERSEKGDRSKVTNQDRKVTNQGKSNEKVPMDDDADVVSQNSDPEIDSPHTEPERTEKKLPQMKK